MRQGIVFVGAPADKLAWASAVLVGGVRCDHDITAAARQMQNGSSAPCSQTVFHPGTCIIIIHTLLLVNILTFLTHYPLGQPSKLNNIADNYPPHE